MEVFDPRKEEPATIPFRGCAGARLRTQSVGMWDVHAHVCFHIRKFFGGGGEGNSEALGENVWI